MNTTRTLHRTSAPFALATLLLASLLALGSTASADPIAPTDEGLCTDTSGTWDECAGSSCDGCDDCIADCLCPVGTVFEGGSGCITPLGIEPPSDETLCTEAGGTWDECAGSSCDVCDDCITDCFCPDGLSFVSGAGCITPDEVEPPSDEQVCADAGGTWDQCATSSCDLCEDCVAGCLCPVGQFLDASGSCVVDLDPDDGDPAVEDGGGCAGGGARPAELPLWIALALGLAFVLRRAQGDPTTA